MHDVTKGRCKGGVLYKNNQNPPKNPGRCWKRSPPLWCTACTAVNPEKKNWCQPCQTPRVNSAILLVERPFLSLVTNRIAAFLSFSPKVAGYWVTNVQTASWRALRLVDFFFKAVKDMSAVLHPHPSAILHLWLQFTLYRCRFY